MKDLELRVLSELMKNSRRSDRQLAKSLDVSQPTVTRIVRKLEKAGYIKEYTVIPDLRKLGYQLMGFTFVKQKEDMSNEALEETRKRTIQLEKENPHADIIAVRGMGLNKNVAFVTFYKTYSDYTKAMRIVKEVPYVQTDRVESFLVNLDDPAHHRLLSMSAVANHILTLEEESARAGTRRRTWKGTASI